MKYFISPDKQPLEKLSEEKLMEIINRNFSNVKTEKIEDVDRAYLSEISIKKNSEDYIDILIPKTLDSLVIQTNIIHNLFQFINEIRKEFLKDENVLLYDESYSYVISIPYDGIERDML